MTKFRCLSCGRMVNMGNFSSYNDARCACGRLILEPSAGSRAVVSSEGQSCGWPNSKKVDKQHNIQNKNNKMPVVQELDECTS